MTTRCQYCFNTSSFIFSTVSCYDTHSESFSIHSISSHQLIILYFQLSFVKQLSNKKHTWRNKMTPYTDHGDTTRLIDCIASKSSSMLVLHLAIVFQHVKQIGQIARCRKANNNYPLPLHVPRPGTLVILHNMTTTCPHLMVSICHKQFAIKKEVAFANFYSYGRFNTCLGLINNANW